ncbi:hypothetical protein LJC26_00425 [Desulfovibrio sp. OttesenSCG-928-O18]|nr:hypothetical protein [Desulfovibrio sp. OttesenSCG-928-O18]
MSGTSRIGGYGGQTGTGRQSGRSASLARFCRGRAVGDVVAGVFLRQETDQLGWALLEGEELLAHLPQEGARPAAGEQVFFRIEALNPEVVLRLLPGNDPMAQLSFILPALPLGQEAVLYVAARDKLDALLLRRPSAEEPSDPALRREAFAGELARNPEAFAAFAETRARSRALCRVGASAGLVFFQHMPWLSRAVSGLEVSLWSKGEAPVFACATLGGGDRLLLRGNMENDRFRYRLGIVPVGGATAFAPERFAPAGKADAEYRGLDPRSRSGAALDVVGRILALAADSGSMATGRFTRKL